MAELKALHQFKSPRAKHGFQLRTCSVASIGCYLPERVLSNEELAAKIDVTEDWIFVRTGIRERRIAHANEVTSDMAAKAALEAMRNANLSAMDIDFIVVATNTPDMAFPATACLVQAKIGARKAAALDIKASGSGFIHALEIGQQFIASHTFDTVMVIGAEKMSAFVDWEDRDTCVLFGDGAGAAILKSNFNAHGLLTTCIGSDGSKSNFLSMQAGGSNCPASLFSIAARQHYVRMEGRAMFKSAVKLMCAAAKEVLNRCEVGIPQIKCIIPHQANRRIIDAFGERIGANPGQLFLNLENYGNTSAASIPIALGEAAKLGHIQRGDLVLLVSFGAGLTWGAALVEW